MCGTTVHISKAGGSALHFAPSLQFNAHRIDVISPIAAQIRSDEYCGLNMRNCNYIVYDLDHISRSVNWRMCAVFGTKFVV
jgi:hypothetical protein